MTQVSYLSVDTPGSLLSKTPHLRSCIKQTYTPLISLVKEHHLLGSVGEQSLWLYHYWVSSSSSLVCQVLLVISPFSVTIRPLVVETYRFHCDPQKPRTEYGFPCSDPQYWGSWISFLGSLFPLEVP